MSKKDVRRKKNSEPRKKNRVVYVLLKEGKVVYVGMSMNLPIRLMEHKTSARHLWDEYAIISDKLNYNQAVEVERALIKTIPKYTECRIFNYSKHNSHNRLNRYTHNKED